MGHLNAKNDNFGILNPLNPPYQGDFKKECVSPIEVIICLYRLEIEIYNETHRFYFLEKKEI